MARSTTLATLLAETFRGDRSLAGEARLLRAPAGAEGVAVSGLAYDSRTVTPGALFFCIPGLRVDGHGFAAEAAARGAVALVVERELDLPLPQVVVDSVRAALGPLSAAFYGRPSERLALVGVTGTNGKTTTTFLIRTLLEGLGIGCGLLGTVKRVVGDREEPAGRTTPEAPDLNADLAAMVESGQRACAMEVSSHALALHRTDGLSFAAAVFTNLTQDHLDFHGTMEAYYQAKRRLFLYPPKTAVVNVGDPYGRRLAAELPNRPLTFGLEGEVERADLYATRIRCLPDRSRFLLHHPGGSLEVEVGLPGRFNVANAVAALGVVVALGYDPAAAAAALTGPLAVPGRMERVPTGLPFEIVVDYAHTPDSLQRVLAALRELLASRGGGRLICVFGAGGDRDRAKRPLMGKAAAELADLAVVTSDNPRSEPPDQIVAEVLAGMDGGQAAVEVVVDRRSAIGRAIDLAAEEDVVLIAGKGHEQGQEFAGGRVVPFDDRRVARIAAAKRLGRETGVARFWQPAALARLSGAALLQAGAPPVPGRVGIDSRDVLGGELFFGLRGEKANGGQFAEQALAGGAHAVLVEPRFAESVVALGRYPDRTVLSHPDPLLALQLLAAGWRAALKAKVVGITGSAGKTSTKQITAALLRARLRVAESKANFNTEIGLPLSLLSAPGDVEAVVLELAMRGHGQIAELAEICDPDVGVIVTIGPVHLGLVGGTLEGVAAAKAELFASMRPGTAAVFPADQPLLAPHLRTDQRLVPFGGGGEVELVAQENQAVVIRCGEEKARIEVPFAEDHQLHNLLAAAAAVWALGVPLPNRLEVSFEPLRGERIELGEGVTLINDCYNANPLSVEAALAALGKEQGRRIAVLGDMLELGAEELEWHRRLREPVAKAGVSCLITVGPRAKALAEVAPCPAWAVGDAEEAAQLLRQLLAPNDVVLVKGSRALQMERIAALLRTPSAVG